MHTIILGDGVAHVHMIGIGGVSMSGLAEILLRDGYAVTGSDECESEATLHLRALGVDVVIGNAAANITDGIHLVVHTAAVTADNPEYRAACEKGLPIIDRAKLLGLIMDGYAYPVCVSGSHGKTTTTSIIADVCLATGLDPTISVGGYMGEGYNFRIGASPYFVMEACEYFDSFLNWRPHTGVILNIDNDHMDYFGSMERLIASFEQFARNIAPDGCLVIYGGTQGIKQITDGLSCRVLTYGTDDADFTARNITFDDGGHPSFDILHGGCFLTRVSLGLIGAHNVLNALATAAVCASLAIPPEKLATGLSAARGVRRRFEHKGFYRGAEVVDDYAHHPTEITASLSAARAKHKNGRIICAFQPHTYSRTKNLMDEFAASFPDADRVLLLPIYASREAFHAAGNERRVTSADLAEKIRAHGQQADCAEDFDDAERILREMLTQGDLLITMGAGDVYLLGERLLGKS